MVTTGLTLINLVGNSAYITFGGAGGDASGYSAFKIYRKEEGLPSDRWELMTTLAVTHNAPPDEGGGTATDTFASTYVDQWPIPCRVNEYVVSGVDNFDNETEDSNIWRVEWALLPQEPLISTPAGQNLKIDAGGFIGCSTAGNGFKVVGWTLSYAYTNDPNHVYQAAFDPSVGGVLIPKPSSGQLVAVRLLGTLENLYETVDPNNPVTIASFGSEDLCVWNGGVIDPNDTDCPDIDGSQWQAHRRAI